MECTLDDYLPGTNASVFSPQGGVRIGMMDLAKIGQALASAEETGFLEAETFRRFAQSAEDGRNPQQEFFCAYGFHLQMIESERPDCLDKLFGGEAPYVGHSGEAYGCLLYTSPSPRDQRGSRMPSSA